MKLTESIGQRIKQVRGEMSQKDFGTRIGLSQTAVTALENDRSAPRLKTFDSIAKAFGVNPEWLRTGQGEMHGEPAPHAVEAPAVATLTRQLVEAHARIQELEAELKEERKQARQDLRSQAALYNSVKEDQAQLITRLYAKLDEYELALGYRKPTAAERQQQEQAGSGAPRLEMIPFGARYRTTLAEEPTNCVMLRLYPSDEVSELQAA